MSNGQRQLCRCAQNGDGISFGKVPSAAGFRPAERRRMLEATQIVSKAQCFHNWPKFEQCVEIKFGVSLEYDDDQEPRLNEEDLTNMWQTYFDQDPFAARLRRMGITEYQVPNDKGVLMVWLVIGCGVAISVAMLAFALWRFSCFEDYSRMPRFSDSDSIQEKRGLDLYPTPHQTLPPLYEQDYKWAHNTYLDSTRVDLGGYANKNYLADDGYGLDSDDEVADARNRYDPRKQKYVVDHSSLDVTQAVDTPLCSAQQLYR
ncbi:hypothetical protein RR46_00668 [Papilio xuthus]|uniref:Uncharacterized protein n=1 Tax=Papilio xuthus TaxID=66420 RepID=A0A0N0PAH9_PAPXU|nr:hypothetical protein RR46_00668 [Papilio xuthus]